MSAIRRFAVVGDPIAHSKSPAMHQAAYRALGLPHVYGAVRVREGELASIVQALRDGTYDGLNVTVPHKAAVLALVDDVESLAREANAANTLVRTAKGEIRAHNTDVPALVAELEALAAGRVLRGERALVLGSGGAARAARKALEQLGAIVALRDRKTGTLTPSAEEETVTRVVVQATSAGMTGADPGEALAAAVSWNDLPDDAIALDVVYAPAETPFLRAAGARGLRRANGFGMLARQGALAFELWLGVPAPLAAMRAALDG
jgi:shikimate dehydrogenase